ncbi:hypothetical protein [Pseudoxanthomonas indica]|uniref:Uncharacterized protein n=1 Tax=Pseudoxanthomonas indica TaxID=428993 RepID=A0A1T5M0A2_9GAMM|nr:hypothetical protein [Pseudoxanthomonas indica]GGD59982.1 hypothetical protein GCM10007235_35180 [Pseudoxanthomonas indica]SKC81671.1 hypothetical protein SAMN06296058_3550 [Pseudoxanthomonas indica]
MSFRRGLAALLAIGLLPAVALAQTGKTQADPIDLMTDALVTMFPVGDVMQDAADKDPTWPLQDKASAVPANQLICLRNELSREGFRRNKRLEVVEYAQQHAANFADETRKAQAVAPVMARMVGAGIVAANTGTELDPTSALKNTTVDELLVFNDVFRDPKYRDLRELTGFGDILSFENGRQEEAGKATGEKIVVTLMLKAMKTCEVEPSALI